MKIPDNGKIVAILCFLIIALGTVQAWDDEEGRRRAAEIKNNALKYAVEQYGDHSYFASDRHCRVPLKGERLEMQHANPRDAGRGYRCTYRIMLQPPTAIPTATVIWSRSPEFEEIVALGRPR